MAKTLIDLGVQAKPATLTNTEVAAAAAIDYSKLAAMTSASFLVGNGSTVPTVVAMGGDMTMANTGAVSFNGAVIVNADVNGAAAIAYSKLNLTSAILNADLAGSITTANLVDGATFIQSGGSVAMAAALAMGTNKITGMSDGTVATDGATKGQLDAAINGLTWKDAVRVATTSDLATLSGDAWVADGDGAPALDKIIYSVTNKTITWNTAGPAAIDGITLSAGDRILVKDEDATSKLGGDGRPYMGIYEQTSSTVWTRVGDMDASAEFEGAAMFVREGTANENTGFTQTADPVTLLTTPLVFALFTATGGDADTLDGIDSLSFLRSDVSDAVVTGVTINFDSGSTLSIDGAWDIGGTGVTSTAAELNILDGVTSTAAELNILDGVTSTAAELNILDGVTSTAAELNILDGVTSTATEINAIGTRVDRETATGDLDGADVTYTLANSPTAGTEHVYLNGVLQDDGGEDYTLATNVLTFVTAPTAGDKVRVSYRY